MTPEEIMDQRYTKLAPPPPAVDQPSADEEQPPPPPSESEEPETWCLKIRDKLAADTIGHWLRLAEREGVNQEKLDKAREDHRRFKAFARENPDAMKLPD